MIVLSLPFPVSQNLIWRAFVQGRSTRTIKSETYRKWEAQAAPVVEAEMVGREPYDVPVAVRLHIRQPDKRRRDLDNMSKACLDQLNGRVMTDDSLVHDLHLSWDTTPGEARALVTVFPLEAVT